MFFNTLCKVAAAAAKSLQSCSTLCDPVDGSPPGSPIPGILQFKDTGVGCHFLLQCIKVKSQSEVAQLYPTLSNPMDCSLPGSSVQGIFQARAPEWGAIAKLEYNISGTCQSTTVVSQKNTYGIELQAELATFFLWKKTPFQLKELLTNKPWLFRL